MEYTQKGDHEASMPTPNQNEQEAIRNLQRYLRQLYFNEEEIPEAPVDGIFDSATEASLRAFQRSRGLPETGIADQRTWELLFDAYRAALALGGIPVSVELFPIYPRGSVLSMGSQGFAVMTLQYLLGELEHTYGELIAPPMDGIYGEKTQGAVRAFQLRNALPPDGIADLLTWNRIVDQYNALFRSFQRE